MCFNLNWFQSNRKPTLSSSSPEINGKVTEISENGMFLMVQKSSYFKKKLNTDRKLGFFKKM